MRPKVGTSGRSLPDYPLVDLASNICEMTELFRPALAHPSSLLPERPSYRTHWGAMYQGDAAGLLMSLPDESLDLVVTSPPYALHFKKEYGNVDKDGYVDWFRPFGREIYRALKPEGSFVLNIGGSYNAGTPTRSLYHFHVLIMLVEQLGFHLAQECFWYNPAKLPSPAEWVNVRRVRIKDSVEYVFWLSKTPLPTAVREDSRVSPHTEKVRNKQCRVSMIRNGYPNEYHWGLKTEDNWRDLL